jgi:hypothetical protein
MFVDPGTGAAIAQIGSKLIGSIFGGGGPNIAKKLSKQVGFTVLQSDAATVRARLAAGLDPRTGQPVSNRTAIAKPPADVRVPAPNGQSVSDIIKSVVDQTAATFVAKKVHDLEAKVGTVIEQVPAVQKLSIPGFPAVSKAILQTPARPRSMPMRQMVPPTPPGGGKVSLMPAAGMAGIGAVARMGARGLVRTTTGRISRIVLPSGQSFSRKEAASLIRRVGFEAAAVALGIGIVEAAELLLTDSKSRRRGRGITAAQVRNARRTTCAVARLARDLGVKPAPVRRRKTSCR